MTTHITKSSIPLSVLHVKEILENAGHEAYIVGGCVRDLIIGRTPKDWDVTTNATPEIIQNLFPDSFYENNYGTVGVKVDDEAIKVIEVTPYRVESGYSDKRRPDEVIFSTNILDDLKRRDFTINAIALRFIKDTIEVIDPYKGQEDLSLKTIRAVGNPEDRFSEDALRILRAIRLSAELGFVIEGNTLLFMKQCSKNLGFISKERIRDEFSRIVMSPRPMEAIELMVAIGVMEYIIPELLDAQGVEQNQAHSYDVYIHLLKSLQCAADKGYPLDIRLTALLHDISKPETRRFSQETKQYTFYGHEVVGSRVTKEILERLKFPVKLIEKAVKMVRWHMFFSDTETITLSAVRRMITNVGRDNIWDLMNVRICDRIGTGRPKEDPYRLRKYHAMIEEALRDPISVAMLKIDGKGIMDILQITPGKKIGFILNALLEEVLNDPTKNTKEYLENRTKELNLLDEKVLTDMAEAGKQEKEEREEEEKAKIASKFRVK